jgi:hypothetical protein
MCWLGTPISCEMFTMADLNAKLKCLSLMMQIHFKIAPWNQNHAYCKNSINKTMLSFSRGNWSNEWNPVPIKWAEPLSLNRRRGRNIRNMEEEEIKKKTNKQMRHDPEQKMSNQFYQHKKQYKMDQRKCSPWNDLSKCIKRKKNRKIE